MQAADDRHFDISAEPAFLVVLPGPASVKMMVPVWFGVGGDVDERAWIADGACSLRELVVAQLSMV